MINALGYYSYKFKKFCRTDTRISVIPAIKVLGKEGKGTENVFFVFFSKKKSFCKNFRRHGIVFDQVVAFGVNYFNA